MLNKQITFQQFVEKLQLVINQPIWRVIHPADGWLFLDLGKKYQGYISEKDGVEKPYTKGEYQLFIKGDWEISLNKNTTESRMVKPNETQKNYFSRMEDITKNFPIKSIFAVGITGNKVKFYSENGYQLNVIATGKDDSLGLTVVQLDNSGKSVAYTHYRYDEELKSLAMISSNRN